MNNEIYEAIRRVVGYAHTFHASNVDEDIKVVEEWIAKTDAEIQS